jgi:phage N-6-adenine-methyltransferase
MDFNPNPPRAEFVLVAGLPMKVHFSSATDIWSTPKEVYQILDAEFGFDFDPCPLNPQFDGLEIEWGSCNFVNPPYSELGKWIKKAYEEFKKNKTVVMLIPSRTDTKAWHDFVMKAAEIRFIKGRLKFGDAKNNTPFPSAIVIFKPLTHPPQKEQE